MKNPKTFCPQCNKIHDNAMIDRFNDFLGHCHKKQLPEVVERELFRAYIAGAFDTFLMTAAISEFPENLAVHLVNQLAINVRDAAILGIDDDAERKRLATYITETLHIKERPCSRNN